MYNTIMLILTSEISFSDYSKVPRSSGDGMENNSEGEVFPQQTAQGQALKVKSVATPLKDQSLAHSPPASRETGSRLSSIHDSHPSKGYTNADITRGLEPSGHTVTEQNQHVSNTFQIPSVYSATINRSSIEENEQKIYNKNDVRTSDNLEAVTLPKPLSVCAKSMSNSSVMDSENLIPKVELEVNSNAINSTIDNLSKEKILERSPECIDSRLIITELEERNSKLVEEKIKLSVQLGVQSKVSDR